MFTSGGVYTLFVEAFWGVKGIDKSKVSRWDKTYIGEVIFDDEFDLSPYDNQKALIDLCSELPNKEFVLDRQVICWTDIFNAWLKSKRRDLMPMQDSDKFNQYLLEFATTTEEGLTFQS